MSQICPHCGQGFKRVASHEWRCPRKITSNATYNQAVTPRGKTLIQPKVEVYFPRVETKVKQRCPDCGIYFVDLSKHVVCHKRGSGQHAKKPSSVEMQVCPYCRVCVRDLANHKICRSNNSCQALSRSTLNVEQGRGERRSEPTQHRPTSAASQYASQSAPPSSQTRPQPRPPISRDTPQKKPLRPAQPGYSPSTETDREFTTERSIYRRKERNKPRATHRQEESAPYWETATREYDTPVQNSKLPSEYKLDPFFTSIPMLDQYADIESSPPSTKHEEVWVPEEEEGVVIGHAFVLDTPPSSPKSGEDISGRTRSGVSHNPTMGTSYVQTNSAARGTYTGYDPAHELDANYERFATSNTPPSTPSLLHDGGPYTGDLNEGKRPANLGHKHNEDMLFHNAGLDEDAALDMAIALSAKTCAPAIREPLRHTRSICTGFSDDDMALALGISASLASETAEGVAELTHSERNMRGKITKRIHYGDSTSTEIDIPLSEDPSWTRRIADGESAQNSFNSSTSEGRSIVEEEEEGEVREDDQSEEEGEVREEVDDDDDDDDL